MEVDVDGVSVGTEASDTLGIIFGATDCAAAAAFVRLTCDTAEENRRPEMIRIAGTIILILTRTV